MTDKLVAHSLIFRKLVAVFKKVVERFVVITDLNFCVVFFLAGVLHQARLSRKPLPEIIALVVEYLLLCFEEKHKVERKKLMCPLSSRQTKKQKNLQINRFSHLPLLGSRGRFSSRGGGEVILARCHTI